ncbi:hypothetical protein PACILC2_22420 [Paenibacillus cisolokensis]|uniref:DeoR faimly transcriptional regulator n=1 Tax=Paenibacillus cisolokensis TaxID=1658519 RepID=A0ABQ4N699_9BACL|nr:hypothetical protein [Paenibacillus cisolokensis]GIQ63674.1 hypothetical protein PACILC2_22420 [Paenibacillus cisolokensis]
MSAIRWISFGLAAYWAVSLALYMSDVFEPDKWTTIAAMFTSVLFYVALGATLDDEGGR